MTICPEELTEHAQHLCKLLYALQMDRKTQFKSIPFLPELVEEMRICQEKEESQEARGDEREETKVTPVTPGYRSEGPVGQSTPKRESLIVEVENFRPHQYLPDASPEHDLDVISIQGSDTLAMKDSPAGKPVRPVYAQPANSISPTIAVPLHPKPHISRVPTPRCYRCNQKGHKQFNCPEKKAHPKYRCQRCRRQVNPTQRFCISCLPDQRYKPY